MTTFFPRVSKLTIIPVDRESLLNGIIHLEKSNNSIFQSSTLSLKDICTRHLLLRFGDDHEIYKMYLSSQLIRYITYEYLTVTNNKQYQILTNDESKILFCRDCSLNDLGASKCRRRKCLANRVRDMFDKLSCHIIPWENGQHFAILQNDDTNENDDDDDDNSVLFIYLKSNNCRYKKNSKNWIQEYFYLLDLFRILHINIVRE
ncbi:unnamed protein product [Adineta steineri]|uniref:Uncharacterized protein n=1 Tax=Adineta steineri TaxID=433720 RepID=A0A813PAP0_9BILA|nr:unnamed protein product [Adineta steineri]CAF0747594.1 unnamed protein product [Adineta steineri]